MRFNCPKKLYVGGQFLDTSPELEKWIFLPQCAQLHTICVWMNSLLYISAHHIKVWDCVNLQSDLNLERSIEAVGIMESIQKQCLLYTLRRLKIWAMLIMSIGWCSFRWSITWTKVVQLHELFLFLNWSK